MSKAIIIGAGLGGMATAIRLAVKGIKVELIEANSFPGGKASEIRKDGFRWDAGPSLFTLPEQLDELFRICGKEPSDYYSYNKLDPITRYFYPDGTVLNAWSDINRLAEEFEEKTGESKKKVLSFLKRSETMYELTADIFLNNSMHKLATYLRKDSVKTLLNVHKLSPFTKMASYNEDSFEDPRIAQLFNRYATYNGSDPYKAPATLNVIAHLEHNMGAWFLDGGMHVLSSSLFRLAREMGVEFRFGSYVEKIVVNSGKVEGVVVDGVQLEADMVVSNMDVVHTYRLLLAEQKQPERILRQPRSSSALIFYWGIKKEFKELDVHNIFFTNDYPSEFKCIFDEKRIFEDPTVYVYISSKKCPDDAPEGHENWFTMINVPHDAGQDWDLMIREARRNILNKLSASLGVDMEALIVTEDRLDPRSIASRTQSYLGALYGNSSNNPFAAFMRHPNFSRRIDNLYFCGGSVHPGGGIPLCLMSAKIIDGLTDQNAA